MSKQITVEDLWPGDVIIARRPGAYTGLPSRFSHAENVDCRNGLARVFLDRGDYEFDVLAHWDDPVELVGVS